MSTKIHEVTSIPCLQPEQSPPVLRLQATTDPEIKTWFRRMAPRRKNDGPHFSVHDFEGARPRIVPVNADGQEREEDNFGAKQQRVRKKRWVRMHIRARLQRRFPYGIRLCICCQLQRHLAVGEKLPEQGLWNARA